MSNFLEYLKNKRKILIIASALLAVLLIIFLYVFSINMNELVLRAIYILAFSLVLVAFSFGLFCDEYTNLETLFIKCILIPVILMVMLMLTSLFFDLNDEKWSNLADILVVICILNFMNLDKKNNNKK